MKLLYKYICASVLLLIVSTGHLFADPISEGQQAYLQGNYEEAIRLVSPLAEKGDILAQFNLGVMYANEKSEIHDNKEASKLSDIFKRIPALYPIFPNNELDSGPIISP